MSPPSVTRRRLLLSTAAAAALAGCGGPSDGGAPSTDRVTGGAPTTTAPVPTTESGGADGAESTTSDGGLDLREANVVGVAFERAGDGYRFDVTLHHDDDGEDGYANWWQVETLDGEQLGRRELLHAHGTTPFTRSETVSIPDGTRYVVVRGHDQTHGYGGDAMVVDLETGETRRIRQGPEPWDLSAFASAD